MLGRTANGLDRGQYSPTQSEVSRTFRQVGSSRSNRTGLAARFPFDPLLTSRFACCTRIMATIVVSMTAVRPTRIPVSISFLAFAILAYRFFLEPPKQHQDSDEHEGQGDPDQQAYCPVRHVELASPCRGAGPPDTFVRS